MQKECNVPEINFDWQHLSTSLIFLENTTNDLKETYTTCIQISRDDRQERSVVF
jgi:hypothetical protein